MEDTLASRLFVITFSRRNVFLRVCVIPSLIVVVNKGRWKSQKTKMPLAFTWRFLWQHGIFSLRLCSKSRRKEKSKWMIWSYDRVEKAARIFGRVREIFSPWFSKSRVCCLRRETLKPLWVLWFWLFRGEAWMSQENAAHRWSSN